MGTGSTLPPPRGVGDEGHGVVGDGCVHRSTAEHVGSIHSNFADPRPLHRSIGGRGSRFLKGGGIKSK